MSHLKVLGFLLPILAKKLLLALTVLGPKGGIDIQGRKANVGFDEKARGRRFKS